MTSRAAEAGSTGDDDALGHKQGAGHSVGHGHGSSPSPSLETSRNLGTWRGSIPRRRLATAVTEGFSPVILIAGVSLAVGASTTWPDISGLAWGALTAFFCSLLPSAFILLGLRLGYIGDHHIRDRRQRRIPLLFGIVSVATGIAVLTATGAPHELLVLIAGMAAGLVCVSAVTVVWKVSFHTAVASGTVTVLTLLLGAAALATTPFVLVIAWSRVALGDHTWAQTFVGAVLGSVSTAGVYFLAG